LQEAVVASETSTRDSIFCRAIEIASAEERAAFIARACGGDLGLRQAVEKLVAAHFRAGSFLESHDPGLAATVDAPSVAERPGTMIGPYKLLQQLGEGGMGTVFMAEQQQPVQRKVALKVIKPGMDSRQVVARFEAERQALALMDHPNIARVFDAGTTPDGRPFFVMELVKGVPITKYCDERRLTPRERLGLFVEVCQAVQHAHQKGVIHRDIKPSNVLVAQYDGKPVPKVIDFGIAKAAGPKLTDRTLFTEFGAVVGTLEYMSPEQAELNQLDIDTRSDVYSLGVLLYELLTGTTPLDRKRLKAAALLEVLRVIREEEPPRPSTRLSTTDELPSIAANRGLEPGKLSGLVRGELDWVVMKALEKDRGRRYESASAFAADVQRYLNDEAVQACPPSAWYRFRKLARRNRAALAAAGFVALVLILATVVSTWQAVRATVAEGLADQRREQAVEKEGEAQQAAARLREEKRQAQISLSTLLLARGLDRCEQGEVDLGLLWLADSLEKAPGDAADLQWAIRANLAAWYPRLAPVKAVLSLPGLVWRVAFSRDGETVVTNCVLPGDRLQELRVWRVATRTPLGPPLLVEVKKKVKAVAPSADGKTLLVGTEFSDDSQPNPRGGVEVQLWDVAAGEARGEPRRFEGSDIAFSPDGQAVLTGRPLGDTGFEVRRWDAATGAPLGPPLSRQEEGGFVGFARDGRTFWTFRHYAGKDTRTARVWDAVTGEPACARLDHPEPRIKDVTLSPDRKAILTQDDRGIVRLWEAATGTSREPPLSQDGSVVWRAFSPDSQAALTGDLHSHTARLWAAATGQSLGTLPLPREGFWNVTFSPDGHTLAGQGVAEQWVRLFGLPSGDAFVAPPAQLPFSARLLTAGHPRRPVAAGTMPIRGDKISGRGREGTNLRVWDPFTQAPLGSGSLRERGAVRAAFQDADGTVTVLLQVHSDGPCRVLAMRGEEVDCRATLPHAEPIRTVAFDPDGKRLLTGSGKEVRLWDLATGELLGPPLVHGGKVTAVAFGPDRRTLLTGGEDRTARLWDATTGEPLSPPLGPHQSAVVALALRPDGRLVATGSDDGAARLWEAAGGQLLASLLPPSGTRAQKPESVTFVGFSPDGRTLQTVHELHAGPLERVPEKDPTTRFWDVTTGKALGPALPARRKDAPLALASVAGEPKRIRLWVQSITELDLDAAGVPGRLTPSTWLERRARLEELGGPPLP
jgi:serine/threonine protein kinase/WD40 repeat protein